MVALAPPVMTISGSTFHCVFDIIVYEWFILLYVLFIVPYSILLLQYVNSVHCIVKLSIGFVGVGYLYASPFTHKMFGLNLALQWFLCWPHV